MATREYYDKELVQIEEHVAEMAQKVLETIDKTIFAVNNLSTDISNEILANDDRIDELETKIEEDCINIVVQQAPIASDWRKLASIMRLIGDLERIADNCSDICQHVKSLSVEKKLSLSRNLNDEFISMRHMMADTFKSYIEGDVALARTVSDADDKVDNLNEMVEKELVAIMQKDAESIVPAIEYLSIAKYVERMADHAASISAWIAFIVEGKLSIKYTDRYRNDTE
ncbi:MAG: phosphate signaling complex protein PhoU [Lachnospiraceae bacterium]|nr:phosphate signaling complex protein PhoU [Lachnospiraceae bacterium]